jgi:hypothetical protein
MSSNKRQKTAAAAKAPPHTKRKKLQVNMATTEEINNHDVVMTKRQSGRFMHSSGTPMTTTTAIQPKTRSSMQLLLAQGTIDDDLDIESSIEECSTEGSDTSNDEDDDDEDPVTNRSKYCNTTVLEEIFPASSTTVDPRDILISELRETIEVLEKRNKEWEEKENDRSFYTSPDGEVTPMKLNKGQKAHVGKYVTLYIYPKIKFVNEGLFSNTPSIINDCMDFLGIKNRIGRLQIFHAAKIRIANAISQQRYSTAKKMKKKCLGK